MQDCRCLGECGGVSGAGMGGEQRGYAGSGKFGEKGR